jgi:hypothetical protein
MLVGRSRGGAGEEQGRLEALGGTEEVSRREN